ncbi:26S proteasome non-ATPase regulatory subunit 5 [Trinorchestia longiramus]|nr:26S proteasome non-ATPase regulatory subunit 5 [Trinorchestia longiramus]
MNRSEGASWMWSMSNGEKTSGMQGVLKRTLESELQCSCWSPGWWAECQYTCQKPIWSLFWRAPVLPTNQKASISILNMGSLSLFITEESVREHLDNAFAQATSTNSWADYFDDCYFYLIKAKNEKAKLSFQGALSVVQFYYKQISSSDDDVVVMKGVHVMEQILSFCHDRHTTECPEWYQLKVSSPLMQCCCAALNTKTEQLLHFGISQILACIKSSACDLVVLQEDVVCSLIRSLGEGVNSVTSLAKTALVTLCENDQGLSALFLDSTSLDALNSVIALSDSAKFNVYEVVQRVCMLGADQLSVVSNSGLLDQLVAEVSSDDTLARLAALQLVSDLVEEEKALDHLNSAGVLHQMQSALQTAHSTPDALDALTIPGLLKVFGVIGRARPELLCSEHAAVVSLMLRLSSGSSNDPCLTLIALETLTQLAASHAAKRLLHFNFRAEMQACLTYVGQQLQSAPVDQRGRFLTAFVHLLSVPQMPQSDRVEGDDLQELLQSWYNTVIPSGKLDVVDKFMRLPFPEVHLEAYRLLLALIALPWGVRMVASDARILKYLVNRSTESSKEGKELKHEVVSALVQHSAVLSEEAGKSAYDALKAYAKQGPFFVQPYVEMGIDQIGR